MKMTVVTYSILIGVAATVWFVSERQGFSQPVMRVPAATAVPRSRSAPLIRNLKVSTMVARPGQSVSFTWENHGVPKDAPVKIYLVEHDGTKSVVVSEAVAAGSREHTWTVPDAKAFRRADVIEVIPYTVHAVPLDPQSKKPLGSPAILGWLNIHFR